MAIKGGKREGAGRKPIQDRNQIKVQFSIYIPKSLIDKAGGSSQLRAKLTQFAESI